MSKELCGYELENGEKCTRPAGWGTDEDKGYCKDHTKSKKKTIKKRKENFLETYKNNVITLEKAANQIGLDQSTVWKYRQKDDEFDKKVEQAKEQQNKKRVDKVEDSMFKRIVKGDATASEVIFYLKNRDPKRWKDKPDVNVNVAQKVENKELSIMERARELVEEEA